MNARVNINAFKEGMKNTQDTQFFNKEAKTTTYGQKSGLTEIGRIRIGEKTKNANGKEYPTSLDYFLFDTINKILVARAHESYGDKPNVLPIFFHTNDIANHCIEELVLINQAGKLVASGDGENFLVYNKKTDSYVEKSISTNPNLASDILEFTRNGLTDKQRANVDWKHRITLRFCIFKVPAAGYWQFQSYASKTSIVALRDVIDQCIAMWNGNFSFLPFNLMVKKVESNSPGTKRTYPVVDLVPAISTEAGIFLAKHIQENPDFSPANFALMDMTRNQEEIKTQLNESTIKLLR